MPRGYPDDLVQGSVLGQTILDISELSARLGSPDTLQRSGNVIYRTSFADGAGDWLLTVSGDAYCKIWGIIGYYTPSSLGMFAGTLGGATAEAIKTFPVTAMSIIGLEMIIDFGNNTPTPTNNLQVQVKVDTGTTLYTYDIKYKMATNTIDIVCHDVHGNNLTYTISGIPTLLDHGGIPIWIYTKLVIDAVNNQFKKLYLNNQVYDLSALYPYFSASSGSAYIQVNLITVVSGTSSGYNIGSVVVTINEP